MAEPYTVSTAEELAASDHIKLRQVVEELETTPMWARRLVREGRLVHARDENGHIWVPQSEVDKYNDYRAERRSRGEARKAGEHRQPYVPQPIKALKRAKSLAMESDFSEEDIALYNTMCDEMIAAKLVEFKDKIEEKNASAAEAEADEGD